MSIEESGASADRQAGKGLLGRLYDTPWLLLTLTALFFGGNTIAGQAAVGHVSPMTLVLLRWILVSAALWWLFGRETLAYWHVARPRLLWLIGMATIGFTTFNALFYVASETTTAVNIGILQGAIPVIVLVGAYLLYGARMTALQAFGVGLTLVGAAVVASQGDPLRVLREGLNPGDGVMLIACVAYAVYTIGLKSRPAIPGRAFFTLLSAVAAATSLPLAVWEWGAGAGVAPTVQGWLVVVYIAIFPSCLSQLFFLRGVDLIGPGKAGVYINLVPIFAAVLAVTLLGQPFEFYHAAALTLTLSGLWLSQRTSAS